MNAAYGASITATVERLEAEKDDITGVVITSAKKTFFAGGDLNDLKTVTKENAEEFAGWVRENKAVLRRLETLGKPVVAAINGAALGGGLEICLACHHRIAVDDSKVQLGFPEVQLGLLPGAGGVMRSVRMFGIVNALMQLLLQGQRIRPQKALEMGLVDELVPTREELVPAAKTWIASKAGEEVAAAVGRQGLQDPRRHARRPRRWPRTCPPSRPTCASRSRAPTTRRRCTSCPPRSRARRSTSTTRRRSRAATSSTSPPARSPRT